MISFAIVVPTKDRPAELNRLLLNLEQQTLRPDMVVIVDASRRANINLKPFKKTLNLYYIHYPYPSAAEQRNVGIRAVSSNIEIVGILDDDVLLAKNSLKNVMRFWQNAPMDIAGCSCKLLNFQPTPGRTLKESALFERLGLYSRIRGKVMPSGWQTLFGAVKKNLFVDWLSIGASFWRKSIFDHFSFDPFFTGYSYLEDLDFTYSVSRHYRLVVLCDAGFEHYHSETARINLYQFGKKEVRNRLYIVKKHGLSLTGCYLGLFGRMVITLYMFVREKDKSQLWRALGNMVGLGEATLGQNKAKDVHNAE